MEDEKDLIIFNKDLSSLLIKVLTDSHKLLVVIDNIKLVYKVNLMILCYLINYKNLHVYKVTTIGEGKRLTVNVVYSKMVSLI